MDKDMFFPGIILGSLLGCFIVISITYNHQYLLPKTEWICVEATQLDKNVDKLKCINYKKEVIE